MVLAFVGDSTMISGFATAPPVLVNAFSILSDVKPRITVRPLGAGARADPGSDSRREIGRRMRGAIDFRPRPAGRAARIREPPRAARRRARTARRGASPVARRCDAQTHPRARLTHFRCTQLHYF